MLIRAATTSEFRPGQSSPTGIRSFGYLCGSWRGLDLVHLNPASQEKPRGLGG